VYLRRTNAFHAVSDPNRDSEEQLCPNIPCFCAMALTRSPILTAYPRSLRREGRPQNVRDCMAGNVCDGRTDLGHNVDVHDEAGAVTHSVGFPMLSRSCRVDQPPFVLIWQIA
jgi:hypothetical protein